MNCAHILLYYYMDEIWKEIVGYPGYWVSNFGRVKSYNQNKIGKILAPKLNSSGYYQVTIGSKSNRKILCVHKLVATEFLPNDLPLTQVNHKDENKHNNNVNNLEWCDSLYNINYGTRNSRVSISMHKYWESKRK